MLPLNKRNIAIGIVVICVASLLGAMIYGNINSQNALPRPNDNPSDKPGANPDPTPDSSPSTSPKEKPADSSSSSSSSNTSSSEPTPPTPTYRTITVPTNYTSISAAVDAANEGDTILVKPGVYYENVTVKKSLTVKGENKYTTEVYGSKTAPAFIIQASKVTLTGFKVGNVETGSPSNSQSRIAGIHLLDAVDCNVYGNIVDNCGKGVWLYDSSGNKISDNVFSKNNYGILSESSTGNQIIGNVASDGWGGIWLETSTSNTLRQNRMMNNIRNFAVQGNNTQYDNDIDSSNTINGGKLYYLMNKENIVIEPDPYPDVGSMFLVNCRGITIKNINVRNDYCGIFLINTDNSTITHCVFSNNTGGIWLQYSDDCVVSENEITQNEQWGVRVESSTNVVFTRNSLAQNGYQSIAINNCTGNSITDNHIGFGMDMGIYIVMSNNNRIINNEIINNRTSMGIALMSSSHNLVQSNTVYPGSITISSGSNNTLASNNLTTSTGSVGISLSSTNTTVIGNIISNFTTGLQFSSGGYNLIAENNITSKNYSIQFSYSSLNNIFYRNNFLGKTNVSEYAGGMQYNSSNVWDNGTYGNYWNDYLTKYPNATEIGSSGIGDTAYIISANNRDIYPLMQPVGLLIQTSDLLLKE